MTARSAAELLTAAKLADHYRVLSISLRREAFVERALQHPLKARIIEQYALIARRAARAEELHPDDALGFLP